MIHEEPMISIPEAAKRLGKKLGLEVEPQDVLKFGLSGRLPLSVNVRNGTNVKKVEYSTDGWFKPKKTVYCVDKRILKLIGNYPYCQINGVWDLAMISAERIHIKNILASAPDSPYTEESFFLRGVILKNPEKELYCIVERDVDGKYQPIHSWPQGHNICVRIDALDDYINTYKEPRKTLPEEIIKRERKLRKTPKDIAAAIDAEWTGKDWISHEDMGRLLPASPGTAIEPSSHTKRGKRLRGKSS